MRWWRAPGIVWRSGAYSQGGRGRPPPPQCQKKGTEREKKENKACMHVKLPLFNHFQSKIKYKFVLYVENTGHMHQIAPLTTSKCKKLSLWEGDTPTPPSPPPSLAPSHVIYTAPPKIKSWLRHCWRSSPPLPRIFLLFLKSFIYSRKWWTKCRVTNARI